ncbi:metalloregulator ArsR/SmtB family transcription factor [Nocardioides sp. SYSU DS0651]|uniref:metalloregulator ArsR/SmtB family transcription factor n=1 Tax=Nocardioides sp. SYSU DS0651 TaxID=3415955 RepID=UPI003F4AFB9A
MSKSSLATRQLPLADDPLASCVPLAREPLSVERAAGVVPLLKAIADPARLRLLSLVLSHEGGEACVCDLSPSFDLSQPTISHHLKILHESGLLDREKRGSWVFYKARPEAMAALASLFTVELVEGVRA